MAGEGVSSDENARKTTTTRSHKNTTTSSTASSTSDEAVVPSYDYPVECTRSGGGGGGDDSNANSNSNTAAPLPQRTSSKKSYGHSSFSSKILLCGAGGTGSLERGESKRKEVDENSPLGSGNGNPLDTVIAPTSRGRKSSRKGSRKKTKEVIPLATLDSENNPSQEEKSSSHNSSNKCWHWCCCCSCLSIKNGRSGSKEANKNEVSSLEHFFSGSDDQPPPLEEIKSWGESFDKLMKCPWGRKVFRDFLRCEYSEENILFWLACEDLKNETDAALIEEKCRNIYEEYISILSAKEVSLDSRVRELINRNMINPSKETFEEAQLQIYTLMHRDSYPRFVNSLQYKQLLESRQEHHQQQQQPPQHPHQHQQASAE